MRRVRSNARWLTWGASLRPAPHSRPDNTLGPSYSSRDAEQNWFRGYVSEVNQLFFANEQNRTEAVRSWILLCATVVAYAFMVRIA